MTDIEELQALLAAQARPACAELTPFEIVAADLQAGSVRLQFAEAKLWTPDGSLAFHATATAHSRPE